MYLIKEAKPLGPRDVMRGLGLSSPSIAYRHLQKLDEIGVVQKDANGNYIVKEKTPFEGYLWIGRSLVPRLLFYSFFMLGLLIIEIAVIMLRIMENTAPIEFEIILLTIVTGVSSALFMTEGISLLRRLKKKAP
jgi:hypothetical protein